MMGIMRVHDDRIPQDRLAMVETADDGVTVVGADAAWMDKLATGTNGFWLKVPPAGSDWERADWDALAHRAGVA